MEFGELIGDVAYHVAEGATEEQREKAVKDVCDAMARFVTGDANATYATASRAARTKMDLLMKYSSQEMFGSVATGIGLSFDPKGATNRFAVTPAGRHALKFVLSRDKAGDIRFGYRGTFSGVRLNVRDERGDFNMKQDNGGTFEYALDVTIPREGLDRFGDADWDALDDRTLMARKQIEFDSKEGWAEKSADAIPEPYRLEFEDLHASFRLHTDNLADLF